MKNTKSKSGKGATLTLTGTGKEGVVVNFDTIKVAASVIRAVNHPIRKRMLEVINLNDGITVTEIYVKLKIEQSVVITSREGKFIHYHINGKRIGTLARVVDKLASE